MGRCTSSEPPMCRVPSALGCIGAHRLTRLAFCSSIALGLGQCAASTSSHRRGDGVPQVADSFGALWDDGGRCSTAVAQGERWPRAAGVFRLVSWNLKWFPDRGPGNDAAPEDKRTDVHWAACVLTGLDADVVVLQEIKLTAPGHEALGALVDLLRENTGATWEWHADDCQVPSWQHVAVLHRTDRVILSHVLTHPEIDPTADGKAAKEGRRCLGQLRPALGAYVRSKNGGLDFHLLDVHLDSGRKDRDYGNRRLAWERFATLAEARARLDGDDDVVVLGDFNTMGCPTCGAATADDEIVALAKTVAAASVPMRSLAPRPRCSEYYRGKGQPIDHAVVSARMREAERAELRSVGPCERGACRNLSEDLPYFKRLTDHCPQVLDLRDNDDD